MFSFNGQDIIDCGYFEFFRLVLGHIQGHFKFVLLILYFDHLETRQVWNCESNCCGIWAVQTMRLFSISLLTNLCIFWYRFLTTIWKRDHCVLQLDSRIVFLYISTSLLPWGSIGDHLSLMSSGMAHWGSWGLETKIGVLLFWKRFELNFKLK